MKQPELCYIDVGGTFTDAFRVDHEGQFTTAKAPSTPRDVSKGFFRAVERGARVRGVCIGAARGGRSRD
jgi:N-methylhydantoinase A/oxoprolinase/acetone carboxylase beta subunit